jgi:hypothetical protein
MKSAVVNHTRLNSDNSMGDIDSFLDLSSRVSLFEIHWGLFEGKFLEVGGGVVK